MTIVWFIIGVVGGIYIALLVAFAADVKRSATDP
jgi:hypothetical protein